MSEVELKGEKLERLIDKFAYDVILQRRKWIGMEMPPIHRLFPHNVRELFELWYNLSNKNSYEKFNVKVDINEFHKMFMKKMLNNKIKCKLVEMKSEFNRTYGSHKYRFNNLRLTKLGLSLYLKILPIIENEKFEEKRKRIKARASE